MWERFKEWTKTRKHTDIWRAVAGVVILFVLLWFLTGCAGGPSLGLGVSNSLDGVIQLKQPLYEKGPHKVSVDYLHHSEIDKEHDEVVYDRAHIWDEYQFDNWRWKK